MQESNLYKSDKLDLCLYDYHQATMSPTQTLSPVRTGESIELSSLPLQASTSSAGASGISINQAERATGRTSNLTEFPDPLGLRSRIYTPALDDDKGS